MVSASGFQISIWMPTGNDGEVEWHDLAPTSVSDLQPLYIKKESDLTVRLSKGVVHHAVIDEISGRHGDMQVSATTVKRLISRKTKSKQSRRVWVAHI